MFGTNDADRIAKQRVRIRNVQAKRAGAQSRAAEVAQRTEKRAEISRLIPIALQRLAARRYPDMKEVIFSEKRIFFDQNVTRAVWEIGSFEVPYYGGVRKVPIYLVSDGKIAVGYAKYKAHKLPNKHLTQTLNGLRNLLSRLQ
jgi:hypothetical protein